MFVLVSAHQTLEAPAGAKKVRSIVQRVWWH